MGNSSRLLIQEKPMMVLPSLAHRIGLEEAVALQQIHYWLTVTEEKGDRVKFKEGRYWVYNSIKEWCEKEFTWWTESEVQRILSSLEKMGLLFTARFESKNWNQRKWFAINYDAVEAIDSMTGCTALLTRPKRIEAISAYATKASKTASCKFASVMVSNLQHDLTETSTEVSSISGEPINQDLPLAVDVATAGANATVSEPAQPVAESKERKSLEKEISRVLRVKALPRNIKSLLQKCDLATLKEIYSQLKDKITPEINNPCAYGFRLIEGLLTSEMINTPFPLAKRSTEACWTGNRKFGTLPLPGDYMTYGDGYEIFKFESGFWEDEIFYVVSGKIAYPLSGSEIAWKELNP